jgi:hypothetical protein
MSTSDLWTNTEARTDTRDDEHKRIAEQIEEFKRNGGTIQQIPSGISADSKTFFIKPLASPKNQASAAKGRKGKRRNGK